jgi:hypothetical protein
MTARNRVHERPALAEVVGAPVARASFRRRRGLECLLERLCV